MATSIFHGLPVGDPIPFPNPAIRPATKGKALVFTDEDDDDDDRAFSQRYNANQSSPPEERPVLIVQQEHFYEIGEEPIRKAIFGQVLYGILLEPSGQQVYHPQSAASIPVFRRTTTEVAIKVYYRDRLRSLQGRTQENPLMEITALQYLGDGHRGIVGQLECAMDAENIYSIMRFYPGGELFDRISSMNAPMTEPQARAFFLQLIAALQRFQELGIAHRDMSLENILCKHALPVEDDYHKSRNNSKHDDDDQDDDFMREEYAVIDFGMCLRLPPYTPDSSSNSSSNSINNSSNNGHDNNRDKKKPVYLPIKRQPACGKRNYIAPEVLAQQEFFQPMLVDIWASGIILFMVLTGVPPIDIASPSDERYNMVAEGRLQEMVLSWGYDFLSTEVLDLIQRILRPEPTERLTLEEMLAHPWVANHRRMSGNNSSSAMDEDR